MIRFDPTVRVGYWRWELMPILVNASMWSSKNAKDLCILWIVNPDTGDHLIEDFSLRVGMSVDGYREDDRQSLRSYLLKHLPGGYNVYEHAPGLGISYDPRKPEVQLKARGAKT